MIITNNIGLLDDMFLDTFKVYKQTAAKLI